ISVSASEDEAPFAERGDVEVIGESLQAGLMQGFGNAPERIAGKHRRSALYDEKALGAEVAGDSAIEGGGVELADGVVGGIGKVDDDEVETVGVGIDPREGVGVGDLDARRGKRALVESGEHREPGEEGSHFGIEIDEGDFFNLRIFENFTDGKAVTATEDENA